MIIKWIRKLATHTHICHRWINHLTSFWMKYLSNECHSMAVNTSALRLDRLSTNRKLNYINDFTPCFSLFCFHSFDEIESAISVKRHKYSIKWLRFAVKKPLVRVFFHPLTMHHIMNWCGKWKLKRSKLNTIYFRLFTRRGSIWSIHWWCPWSGCQLHFIAEWKTIGLTASHQLRLIVRPR